MQKIIHKIKEYWLQNKGLLVSSIIGICTYTYWNYHNDFSLSQNIGMGIMGYIAIHFGYDALKYRSKGFDSSQKVVDSDTDTDSDD